MDRQCHGVGMAQLGLELHYASWHKYLPVSHKLHERTAKEGTACEASGVLYMERGDHKVSTSVVVRLNSTYL